MRIPAWALLAFTAASVIFPSCREEHKIDIASRLNPKKMATMTTVNVATLISDSGVIQYKIVAPLWTVYDQVDTPYWNFPKGLYLQKYDPYFHVIATVAADSAKYFKNLKLWRLDGNVELTKAPKGLFLSQQLFWDQGRHKIYSDSFMHIETETHVLEGIGFESNEDLTSYRVIQPQGIFPVNRDDFHPGASTESQPVSSPAPSSQASSSGQPEAVEVQADASKK